MTTTISSVSARPLVPAKPLIPMLVNIADQLWAMVIPQSKVGSRTQEAIAILRDASADADRCDWAERYLCGMVDANESSSSAGKRR